MSTISFALTIFCVELILFSFHLFFSLYLSSILHPRQGSPLSPLSPLYLYNLLHVQNAFRFAKGSGAPETPAREALVVDHRLVRDAESLGAEHAHERPAELLVPDRGYHRDHPAGVAEGGGGSGAESHPDDEDDGGEEEERGGDEGGAMPVPPGPGAPLEQRRVLRDHAFVRRCVGARHGE